MKSYKFTLAPAIMALIMAAALTGAPQNALAVDFKIQGQWLVGANYGENGNFTNKGHEGFNESEDDFEARSRVRLWMDAVASETLSGQVYFEIGKFVWGKGTGKQSGGALGADASIIKLKRAYLDWTIPDTDIMVRMGIQAFRSPYFALNGPTVLTADGAGITATWKANEILNITAFWMRPYNDNYISSGGRNDSGFMDNTDVGGLFLPLTFNAWRMTPWAIYAATGPNTFRAENKNEENNPFFGQRINQPDGNYFFSGMFPLLANEKSINPKTPHTYGNAWWAGLTGEIDIFEPFRLAWEITYGSSSWEQSSTMNRKGWMGAILAEYKLDWGIPGIYGWYSSGDDDDLGNGSERLPYLVNDFGVSGFNDSFAGPSINGMERDRVMANTLIGTWGIGARLKDVSWLANLRHTLHVSLWGGTNNSGILEKIHERTGRWMSPNVNEGTNFVTPVGRDNIYLTDKDHALETGLLNQWKIYENLTFNLEAAYIHLMLDKSDNVWGKALTGGGHRDIRDAWNISALWIYQF